MILLWTRQEVGVEKEIKYAMQFKHLRHTASRHVLFELVLAIRIIIRSGDHENIMYVDIYLLQHARYTMSKCTCLCKHATYSCQHAT